MSDGVRIQRLGRLGERIAEGFLHRQGCSVIERNTRADGGEVDLIVRDGGVVAVVEVKMTTDGSNPIDSVDDRKFSLVSRTAAGLDQPIGRIDIVGIRMCDRGIEIRWLRGPD